MYENQIRGLIALFLILAIIPLIIFLSNSFLSYKIPAFANQYNNTLTLEIIDKDAGDGIYFTAPGTTANQLLALTGIDFRIGRDFMLENAMKLTIDTKSARIISLTTIDNSRKLALGMPIDLNLATFDDLLLIPGIGEITANKILTLRSKKIRFRNIEELMEVDGIKEKKLAKLKIYLSIRK